MNEAMNAPVMITNMGAQGDLLFRRVEQVPADVHEVRAEEDGKVVLARSQDGHDHVVEATQARLFENAHPLLSYLRIDGAYADVVHERSFDTHAPLRLVQGVWEVRRQREYTPEGYRRVED